MSLPPVAFAIRLKSSFLHLQFGIQTKKGFKAVRQGMVWFFFLLLLLLLLFFVFWFVGHQREGQMKKHNNKI
jgi:hypothetical protein